MTGETAQACFHCDKYGMLAKEDWTSDDESVWTPTKNKHEKHKKRKGRGRSRHHHIGTDGFGKV